MANKGKGGFVQGFIQLLVLESKYKSAELIARSSLWFIQPRVISARGASCFIYWALIAFDFETC